MYLLDTDHLSILEYDSIESLNLQVRLDRVPSAQIATSIITYEDQMRGWLARVAVADTTDKLQLAYSRLLKHVGTFAGIPVLPVDDAAIEHYVRLRNSRVRIGTMDLKIAAIALANDALLLTRNRSDFEKVLNLRFEDWTI